ncbi:hypothetical protein GCM10028803_21060 [Larkinella knui]|nr:CBM35 domain-containing protein [Larkinella knui]
MQSNRTKTAVGQPVELTITAQYFNLSPALLYTFASSNSFRLKLILPEGFVRTGGDYADLISTELSPTRSFVRYTVTGYFTQAGSETTFRLLRSHANADQTSLFVEKARLSLTVVNSAELVSNRQAREGAASCTSFGEICSGNQFEVRYQTISVATEGDYPMAVSYRSHEKAVNGFIRVNNRAAQPVAFPMTTTFQNQAVGTVHLQAGNNSIGLSTGPAGGYICFNSICLDGASTSGAGNPTPPASNPSGGNYDGNFEGANCDNIWGWVYDRNNPNAPVTIEVLANGQVIGSISAAEYRPDLQNAGKGNGQHSFNFTPPASMKNNQNQSISVRVQGSGYTLVNGPKTIQCAGSGNSGGNGISTHQSGNNHAPTNQQRFEWQLRGLL